MNYSNYLLVQYNNFELLFSTDDLYQSGLKDEILQIHTFYEKQYLTQGLKINYLKFRLPKNIKIEELPSNEE